MSNKETKSPAVDLSNKFQKYADKGLLESLLPIIPPGGKLSPNSKLHESHLGKIPGKMVDQVDNLWSGFTKWTEHETTETDIANWTSWPCGIGLQSRHHPGFDIDVNDPDLVDEIEFIIVSELGVTARRSRDDGSPRKILIYKLKDGEVPPKKQRVVFEDGKGMVELLSDGQHYVIEGQHPKGGLYTNDLITREIVEVTVSDIERVIEAIKANFGTESQKPTRTRKSKAGRVYAESGSRSVETMQRIIQQWEPDTGRWDALRDYIFGGIKDRGKRFTESDAQNLLYRVPEQQRDDTWDRYYNEIPNLVEGAHHRIDSGTGGYADEILSPGRAKPLEWLWKNRICKKALTTIVGPPGVSKSTLMCDIVAHITTGKDWPDGCPVSTVGDVLWLNGEDPVDEVVIPRLQAAVADVKKVQMMPNKISDGLGHRMLTFKKDIGEIRRRLDANPNIKLLIVDPISAFLEGADSHNMAEVRNILSTLQGITEEYGISVIVVTHPVKNFKGLLVDAVSGSAAFQAAARMIAGVLKNPTLEGEILFGNIKSNHTKSDMPTLRYVVEEVKRPDLGPDASYGKVAWQPGESDIHIEKIVGEKYKADTKAGKDLVYRMMMMKHLNDGPMPKTIWERVVKTSLTKSGNTITESAFNKLVRDMVDEGIIDRKKIGSGRGKKMYIKKADQEWPEVDENDE